MLSIPSFPSGVGVLLLLDVWANTLNEGDYLEENMAGITSCTNRDRLLVPEEQRNV